MLPKALDTLGRLAAKRFHAILALLCLAYFALSWLYLRAMPLIMDEFQGASQVYAFSQGIPYVHFTPYKTILGYYIQLPALMLPGDIWSRLLYVKAEMVLLNGAAVFLAGHMLRRHFRPGAILIGALALLTVSNFLEHGNSLRVDGLTAWFGLFSFLCLLRGRMIASGLLLAASFLTSQKGVYYVGATFVAMCAAQLVKEDRPRLRDWLLFGAAAGLPVGLYFLSFTAFGAKAEGVARQVVVAHKAIALDKLYRESTMADYWTQTLERNPLFYGEAALGLLVSLVRAVRSRSRAAALCLAYGATLLGLCVWHKQSWPYFFLILIPTGWILVTALFDAALALPRRAWPIVVMIVLCGIAGAAYPLQRIPVVMARAPINAMQRSTVALADRVVGEGEYYWAGMSMLFDRPQPAGVSWLDWKNISRTNRDWRNTVETLKRTPPKAYIDNYRLQAMRGPIRKHLRANYNQLLGNVYLYCPTIPAGSFRVAFDGKYVARGLPGDASATLDGKPIASGRVLDLKAGAGHRSGAGGWRLCLVPPDGWRSVVAEGYRKTREFDHTYTF